MPDLILISMQQCKNWACDAPEWRAQWGCWPYLKSKKGYEFGTCKHVCQWHEQIGPESQTKQQKTDLVCPRCGGPTEIVMVGV